MKTSCSVMASQTKSLSNLMRTSLIAEIRRIRMSTLSKRSSCSTSSTLMAHSPHKKNALAGRRGRRAEKARTKLTRTRIPHVSKRRMQWFVKRSMDLPIREFLRRTGLAMVSKCLIRKAHLVPNRPSMRKTKCPASGHSPQLISRHLRRRRR